MMLEQRKAQGFVRGCIVPILTIVGILGVCFLACLVLFNLNRASLATGFFPPLLFG